MVVSKPLPFPDHHLLFRVQEELPEAVPPFKEVRAKVLAAWPHWAAKPRISNWRRADAMK